jgi:pimeloyl-ACP methyl ester carboxylesterase
MTVVLVHGLGATKRSWDLVAPHLGTDPFLAVDLPGFGSRAAEARRDVTLADMAAALAEDMDAAGLSDAVVAGHSMGGIVATALAETRPGLVGRLVLFNTPTAYEARLTARTGREGLMRSRVAGPLLWRLMNDDRAREGLRTAFAPGFSEIPDVFVEDLVATPWAGFAGGTTAIDDYLQERPLAARLGALPVPVTFVFGDEDSRVDPASLSDFDDVAGVEVVRLPGVGHTPIWEAPERSAEAIKGV